MNIQVKKRESYFLFILLLLFLFPNCGKQEGKRVEEMTFDEIKQKTLSALDRNKNDEAVAYLEKMVAQNPDNQDISTYKLKLADLYFDTGNLPSAYHMYEHFTQFYPSDAKSEYAFYRSILSRFYQTLKIDCDQSSTQDTIKLCEKYLTTTMYRKYKTDIKDIQNTCERKLIDKEVYVYNFYLKKGKYESAKNRLKYLKDNYLSKKPEIEARLLFLECKLEQRQKNNDLVKEKVEMLVDKYPGSHFTSMSQRLINKNKFIF